MTRPRQKAYSIAVAALHAEAEEGWRVRWQILRGMVEVIFGTLALAYLVLAVGGFLLIIPAVLYFNWTGKDFVVFSLVAGLLFLAYLVSSLQRDVVILSKAMHAVADTLGEGDGRH